MSFYADRNYIHSKVYALHSYLLDRRGYAELTESGNLQKIHPSLSSDLIESSPMKAKENLFTTEISAVQLLMHAGRYYRDLLMSYIRIYELNNFRLLLSRAMGRDEAMHMWYDLGDDAVLGRELLNQELTPAVLNEAVSSTYIEDLVMPQFSADYDYNESLTGRAALSLICSSMVPFLFREKRELARLTASAAVIMELVWSMRLDRMYGWDREKIGEYIIENMKTPSGKSVPASYISFWKNHFESRAVRAASAPGAALSDEPEEYSRFLGDEFYRFFSKNFYGGFDSINPLVSYLVLHALQIRNLFFIIESTRAKLPAASIMKNIICGE